MIEQELNIYWKTVVDTIQDGLMIVDPAGTIVSVNKALLNMTGFKEEELVGRPCSSLPCDICHLSRKGGSNNWCVLFSVGHIDMKRCTLRRKDGFLVHVLKNASLLKDAKGKVVGAVETLTDITEIIEKEHQIEAYRRELESEDGFHGILGSSHKMKDIFDLIENAAQSDAPVIIFGESGTGKELVAKAVH